jgi:hypothetical protein
MGTTLHITAKLKAGITSGMRVSGTLVAVNAAGISFPQYAGGIAQSGSPTSSNLLIGIGTHEGGSSTAQNISIVSLLVNRHIDITRVDLSASPEFGQPLMTDYITRLAGAGITIQGILATRAKDDHTVYTGANSLSAWEANNRADASALIALYGPMGVSDFELLNEVTLRPECTAQVGQGTGISAGVYNGKTAYISIGRALKGIADAVVAANSAGASYRIILGMTDRDFGFGHYMRGTASVTFTVAGYHNYANLSDDSLLVSPYHGTGGPIGKMAEFGLPITYNEFNAGEVYGGTYTDTSGDSATEKGFASFTRHTRELYNQTSYSLLESLVYYELYNHPTWGDPEGNFGLLSDAGTPKVTLNIATAFAGGPLTTAEAATITGRGLMSAGEIAALLD